MTLRGHVTDLGPGSNFANQMLLIWKFRKFVLFPTSFTNLFNYLLNAVWF